MNYDYSKLLGRITEIVKTRSEFAQKLGITKQALSAKLNNKSPWKQPEIDKACVLLNIHQTEIGKYFFNQNVQH